MNSDTLQRCEHRFVAMASPCYFRFDCVDASRATAAIAAAETEVRRLESKYSRYRPDSLTSTINSAAGSGKAVEIDTETAGLFHYADTLFAQSDGRFDLTAGILRRAWDFSGSELPKQRDIDALLPLIGWQQLHWDQTSVALPRVGMEIDFGGCVKEYASDSAAAIFRGHGLEHALVNLAGDIAVSGPQGNGEPWRVAIRHPDNEQAIAAIPLAAGGLASSGDYARCLVVDGRRYGHILDPRSGWPVEGLVAVSVLAEQCLVAGSAATVAMLKPLTEALDWLNTLGVPWLAIDRELRCHGSIDTTEEQ